MGIGMTLRPRRPFAQTKPSRVTDEKHADTSTNHADTSTKHAGTRTKLADTTKTVRIRARGCGCEQTDADTTKKVYQTNPFFRPGAINNAVPPKKRTQTNPNQTHLTASQSRPNPNEPTAPGSAGWHGQARPRRAPPCLPLCHFVAPSLLPDSSTRLHPFRFPLSPIVNPQSPIPFPFPPSSGTIPVTRNRSTHRRPSVPGTWTVPWGMDV